MHIEAIYGLGGVGRKMLSHLVAKDHNLKIAFDAHETGNSAGVPVEKLDEFTGDGGGALCLIALHNHYIDLAPIAEALRHKGYEAVLMAQYLNYDPFFEFEGYWLEPGYDYSDDFSKYEELKKHIYDLESCRVLERVLKYRANPHISTLPEACFDNEYWPLEIMPNWTEISLIDCGACGGEGIEAFQKWVTVSRVLALEPDLKNYQKLITTCNVQNMICLPMGISDTTRLAQFDADNCMASAIKDDGDSTIQLVSGDDLVKGEFYNVIKFDIEGAELDALNGFKTYISQNFPLLAISVYHKANDWHILLEWCLQFRENYRFTFRLHQENSFGLVLYCIPIE